MAARYWCLVGITTGLILAAGARAQELPDSSSIPKPLLEEYAKATVDGWVWFGGGFKQQYWYLPKTIRKTPRGTSTVWAVNIQEVDSTNDWTAAREAIVAHYREQGMSTVGYEHYLLTKVQWEVDCVHQRSRVIQLLDYAEDGHVLFSGNSGDKLEDPVPETNAENILRSFCNPRLRVTFRRLLEPK